MKSLVLISSILDLRTILTNHKIVVTFTSSSALFEKSLENDIELNRSHQELNLSAGLSTVFVGFSRPTSKGSPIGLSYER